MAKWGEGDPRYLSVLLNIDLDSSVQVGINDYVFHVLLDGLLRSGQMPQTLTTGIGPKRMQHRGRKIELHRCSMTFRSSMKAKFSAALTKWKKSTAKPPPTIEKAN